MTRMPHNPNAPIAKLRINAIASHHPNHQDTDALHRAIETELSALLAAEQAKTGHLNIQHTEFSHIKFTSDFFQTSQELATEIALQMFSAMTSPNGRNGGQS